MRRHADPSIPIDPRSGPLCGACLGPTPPPEICIESLVPATRTRGARLGARRALLTASLVLAMGAASAQALDTSGDYRQEIRACHEGRTAQTLSTCLLEARNAEADRRRGLLANQGDFRDNALARCQVFQTADDLSACQARIEGPVEITGSVAGGGILRQVAISTETPEASGSEAMGAGPQSDETPNPPLSPDTLPEDDPDVDTEERMLNESDDSA
jgi:hypothetical protein